MRFLPIRPSRAAGLVPAQVGAGVNPAARSVGAGVHPAARGVVLLVVLVVVAMLSLACATFSELMRVEHAAARISISQAQARALADSGIEMARVFMLKDDLQQEELGGWYDNPDVFRGVPVIDDENPRRRGRVAMVAPLVEDGAYQGIRFGLEDESTRLNLNVLMMLDEKVEGAGREILMGLPGMTEDIADAILDWLDEDDEPREFGAEKEEYASLDTPYVPKNGPLETVEELLLVRDVTPWLMFRSDANRNGYQAPDEPDAENLEDVDNA
ncbi:MAG: general secretion pathway protein GspK, partial [Candidatus Nealsonbacteria bacterium]|nr:general secretion pathway protein GspK [Candidatus Nealsonbacteria bacterium]